MDNTTASFSNLLFHPVTVPSLVVSSQSTCTLSSCGIIHSEASSVIFSDSTVILVKSDFVLENDLPTTSPFVASLDTSKSSNVHFISNNLSNIVSASPEPVLASNSVQNISILESSLSNISSVGLRSLFHPQSLGNVSFVNSQFKDSDNILSGGLFRRMSATTSFFGLNTTITNCHSNSDTTSHNHSMTRQELSASHSFLNCTWKNIASPVTHGGAIYGVNVGDLRIDRCTFDTISATAAESRGGGIYWVGNNQYAFFMNDTLFTACSCTLHAACLSINDASKLNMFRCNFTDSTSGRSTAGMYIGKTPEGSAVSNLRFENCAAENTIGGAGAIDNAQINNDFHYSNMFFSGCSAFYAGAVYYSTTYGTPDITWFSCIFFQNEAFGTLADSLNGTQCSRGNDVYFGNDAEYWNETLERASSFVNCFSNSDQPRIAIVHGLESSTQLRTKFTNGTSLSDHLPNPAVIVSKRSAGNSDTCGTFYDSPCASLGYAGSQRLSDSTGQVLVEAGLFEENVGFVINSKSAAITSYGNENPLFDLTKVQMTFIEITNGFDLTLKYLSFVTTSQSVVKHVGTGQLTLQLCSLFGSETAAPANTNLISISGGSLVVSSLTLSSLVLGSGRVVDCASGSSVKLDSVFCVGLETTADAPISIRQTAELALSNLHFEDCVGASFSDLMIDDSTLNAVASIPVCTSTSASPRTPTKDNAQLTQWPAVIEVDGIDGADVDFCWESSQKCRTVENVLARLGSNFEGKISLKTGTTDKGRMGLASNQQLEVEGESRTDSQFEMESSEQAVVSVPLSASLSLTKLTLVLPPSLSTSPAISSHGTLSFNEITFSLSPSHSSFTKSVISAESGSVLFSSCVFHASAQTISTFATLACPSQFVDVSFSSLKLSASLVKTTESSSFLGCSFASLEDVTTLTDSAHPLQSTIGQGQLLTISKSPSNTQTSFLQCASRGDGAALHCTVVGTGSLSLSSTSFSKCGAIGNGGCVFLDLLAFTALSQSKISITDITFGQDDEANSASEGTKLFVRATSLSVLANSDLSNLKPSTQSTLFTADERNEFCGWESNEIGGSLLFFWFPYTAGPVHIHSEGTSHANCGVASLPCSSIAQSMGKMAGEEKGMLVDSNHELSTSLVSIGEEWTLKRSGSFTLTLTDLAQIVVKDQTAHLTLSSLAVLFGVMSTHHAGSCVDVSSGSLSIESCSFGTAESELPLSLGLISGGVVEISGTTTINKPSQSLALFSVTGGQCVLSAHGDDFTTLLPSTPSNTLWFNDTERDAVSFGEMTDSIMSTPLSTLYPFHQPTTTFSVRAVDGKDHPLCGHSFLPCSSLQAGVEVAKGTTLNPGTVLLETTVNAGSGLATQPQTIKLTGAPQAELEFSFNTQIVVAKGDVAFEDIMLSFPSSLDVSPFVVSGGSLTIEPSSKFTHAGTEAHPTTLATPLFSLSSGSLSIVGTESSRHFFSFFSSSSGSCILSLAASSSSTIAFLSFCSFTFCRSTSQAGVFTLSGTQPATLSVVSCYFNQNEGTTANDVHLSDIWSASVTRELFSNSFSDSHVDHLVVHTTPNNLLLPYSVLGVDSESLKDATCYLPSDPCSSVAVSLALCVQKETNGQYSTRSIELSTDSEEQNTMRVDEKRVVIFGRDETKELSCLDSSSSLLIVSNGSAEIHTLVLVHNHPSSSSPLLSLTSNGSITLNSVSSVGLNNEYVSPFLISTLGSVSLANSNFSTFTLSSPFIQSTGPVSIDLCEFHSIHRSIPGPAVLHATISDSVAASVKHTSFTDCQSDDEDRWIELKGNNSNTFST
ncbi:hypothetical protein BLNAU_15108 [Blattamonas nauphoetae]|uniref:Uncharacterized protein n=1 Tax=Blattamonas nauphoetae TaxID=2049346 RepID=A0ABQ9XFG1_9EUKA|nr:hypothetical protein BLNAU_15108 [Blattamonas nauphoetae]